MKDLRVSDDDLLMLMDAVILYESAMVFTHNSNADSARLCSLRERIRVIYNDL